MSEENQACGFVALIGAPNAGKSTLINALVGTKVAIVSRKVQTTRSLVRGIALEGNTQIIFVDTPGIHKPHHELGKVLVKNAKNAISAVDIVLFVADSTSPLGGGDRYVADLLADLATPVVLGLNKLDQLPADDRSTIVSYAALARDRQWPVLSFSALTGEGTADLQSRLSDLLEPGPYYYPPDLVTDQPERFIMGELIREQILHLTRQEIPHSVAIVIEKVEETPQCTRLFAAITVERDSQKGILIGKKGSMLKAIGTAARQQIQKLIDGDVYLQLFVKVEPQWRQSRSQLADLGYRIEE